MKWTDSAAHLRAKSEMGWLYVSRCTEGGTHAHTHPLHSLRGLAPRSPFSGVLSLWTAGDQILLFYLKGSWPAVETRVRELCWA